MKYLLLLFLSGCIIPVNHYSICTDRVIYKRNVQPTSVSCTHSNHIIAFEDENKYYIYYNII